MKERLTSDAWEPRTFNYVDVDNRSYKNCVDITLNLNGTERKARLPRKLIKKRMIMIFPNDKQITMPAWLCVEQKLPD